MVATLSENDEVCVLLFHPTADASLLSTTDGGSSNYFPLAPSHLSSTYVTTSHHDGDDLEVTVSRNQIQALESFEQQHSQKQCDKDNKNPNIAQPPPQPSPGSTNYWKSCGDTLMKLGDASCAISYYEHALQASHPTSSTTTTTSTRTTIQIGSTVLLQIPFATRKDGGETGGWYLWLAEVDCVEEEEVNDDDSNPLVPVIVIDVTILAQFDPFHNRRRWQVEEQTITVDMSKQYILPIITIPWVADSQSYLLQPPILLNLTRCFLQLANELGVIHGTDPTTSSSGTPLYDGKDPKLATAYCISAILSTTMVDMIVSYYQQQQEQQQQQEASRSETNGDYSKWQTTAWLLRAKVWLRLGQYTLALADTERVLSEIKDHSSKATKTTRTTTTTAILKEARILHRQIAQEQKLASKQTRRLVKEMCQWIDGVTNDNTAPTTTDDANNDERMVSKAFSCAKNDDDQSAQNSEHGETKRTTWLWDLSTMNQTLVLLGWLTVLLILFVAFVDQKGFSSTLSSSSSS